MAGHSAADLDTLLSMLVARAKLLLSLRSAVPNSKVCHTKHMIHSTADQYSRTSFFGHGIAINKTTGRETLVHTIVLEYVVQILVYWHASSLIYQLLVAVIF